MTRLGRATDISVEEKAKYFGVHPNTMGVYHQAAPDTALQAARILSGVKREGARPRVKTEDVSTEGAEAGVSSHGRVSASSTMADGGEPMQAQRKLSQAIVARAMARNRAPKRPKYASALSKQRAASRCCTGNAKAKEKARCGVGRQPTLALLQ